MKLIKLQDKFILVSDEVIKVNDFYLQDTSIIKCIEEDVGLANMCYLKIIAGIPNLPSIDFSLLKEEDCKEIGWVDVEKSADSSVSKVLLEEGRYWNDQDAREPVYYGIIEGFKTAQSLNDKMFTLEEMRKAMFEAYKNGIRNPKDGKESFSELSNRVIQSLQKTEWDVEVEMEDNLIIKGESDYFNYDNGEKLNVKYGQPKITNNSIKVIRIL